MSNLERVAKEIADARVLRGFGALRQVVLTLRGPWDRVLDQREALEMVGLDADDMGSSTMPEAGLDVVVCEAHAVGVLVSAAAVDGVAVSWRLLNDFDIARHPWLRS